MGSRPTESVQDPNPKLAWWQIVLLGAVGVIVLLMVAFVVFFALYSHFAGDPAPPKGIPIENDTDTRLVIYTVIEWGFPNHRHHQETRWLSVPANTTTYSGITCGNIDLVARTPSGTEVARREGSGECNEQLWVIGSPSPPSSPATGPE
jgi:hypothetical protein